MGRIPKELKRFRAVTLGAVSIAALLWWSAGAIAVYSGSFYSYLIVALLATVFQSIALISAKKEGLENYGN